MAINGLFVGMATIDLQYLLDVYPPQNMKVNASRFGLSTGGPATNAAVTFAYLGGSSRLYAAIGNHPFTPYMRQELAACGVEITDLAPDSPRLPPFSSILTTQDRGQRTVVAYAADVSAALEPEQPVIRVEDFDILLLDGFQMPVAHVLAKQAREAGIPVVLDGGSWKDGLDSLLEFVDIAICSADFHPPGKATRGKAQVVFDYLLARGIRQGAITRGEQAILYYEDGQTGEIPVPAVQVVDTLGAGDIFHGAFCYHFALRQELPDALSQAAAVAAKSCRSFGTRSWMMPR